MAVLTNQQFFFVAGSVALLAGVAAFNFNKLAPQLTAAVKQAGTKAKQGSSTLANAPLQATRDPLADSSNFGTEAWASQQASDIQKWLGINQPKPNPSSPYGSNRADSDDELPVFEVPGGYTPYFPEGN